MEYKKIKLNSLQQKAVEYIDGPLLVIAGPGTGKTQLLSSRVAYILENTDTLPQNILCLTFTESGASNMRDRLNAIIGKESYNVNINTYHAFGTDIIKNYPEYFETIGMDRTDDIRLEKPIDDITQIQTVGKIIDNLTYDDPMLGSRYFVKDVISTISDLKRNLIKPADLEALAEKNLAEIKNAQNALDIAVNNKGGFSRTKTKNLEQYTQLYEGLATTSGELIEPATKELAEAILEANSNNSTKPVTAWKNKWLHKNDEDIFTLTNPLNSEKMLSLAKIYKSYEQILRAKSQYDYDDMILKVIETLDSKPELLFNLQEKYQYILLDEFQDTNPSQFKLIFQIANHPVHEGRPNIMAVGDDDQAIYEFQGSDIGNMKHFIQAFKDVEVISLTENYRSHQDIINASFYVAEQIEERLHHNLDSVDKFLTSANNNLPKNSSIDRKSFPSQSSEYSWVASKIGDLIKTGVSPAEIAVLSPRHKLLEQLVPFFAKKNIAVTYEKRENILETQIVESLIYMCRLLLALSENDTKLASKYFMIVLSLPFWQIDIAQIWKVNWQHASYDEKRSWAELALEDPELERPVKFFLALANLHHVYTLEETLDSLSGIKPLTLEHDEYFSPLRQYYFSKEQQLKNPLEYYEAISHLSVIRSKLRDHQNLDENKLNLEDFLEFIETFSAAEQPMINSHPIAQSSSSVNLMTVYKAKGLEFENVFILSAHDDVWGSKARSSTNKVSLPINLKHIRYAGSTEDELKRLLFVALSRSKHGLHITSHDIKDSGKRTEGIKYLGEAEGISQSLPEGRKEIISEDVNENEIHENIETLWTSRHNISDIKLKSLLSHRLKTYRMSPTHLNSFLDLEYGGPEAFLFNTLLRFPQAPTVEGEYGTAIHNTLQWYQNRINEKSKPNSKDLEAKYNAELKKRYIPTKDFDNLYQKGINSLSKYISARGEMFDHNAKTEVNFYSEGVLIGDAHLSGKIDWLEVDHKNKTVNIADYKTGGSFKSWKKNLDTKQFKYQQQLYMYKLLIEGSNSFKGYEVKSARLEFVEPDKLTGKICPALYLDFDESKQKRMVELIQKVWQMITELNFPDTSKYSQDYKGTKDFEADILAINN